MKVDQISNISADDIRARCRRSNIKLWQVACCIGIHETTFIRWLREPITITRAAKICGAIDALEDTPVCIRVTRRCAVVLETAAKKIRQHSKSEKMAITWDEIIKAIECGA